MARNPDLHKNHRKRTLDTYLSQDCENIPDHILLEMLLYFSIPRSDTNELAHRLIDRCGSFNNVLDASEAELTEVSGIGKHSADLIRLFGLVKRKYDINAAMPAKMKFNSLSEIGEYLIPLLKNRKEEVLYVLMLDSKNKLMMLRKLNEGVSGMIEITVKKIIEAAISCKCSNIVLAHNHPGGDCTPSDRDVFSTIEIKRACDSVDVTLSEHFIVAGDCYTPILEFIRSEQQKQLKKYNL